MSDFKNYLFEKFIKNHKRLKKLISLTGYCKQDDMYWGSSDNYEQYVSYEVWKYQQARVDELQKRVDAARQLIEDLNKCYQQDHQNKFEYWRGFADSAGIFGKRLEQALKGGDE